MVRRSLGILGLLALIGLIIAGCGEQAAPTPTSTTTVAPAPTVTATTPTEATSTPSSPLETVEVPSAAAARYSWDISTVDERGAKPSIAIDAQDVPHIAYMLEAMPGFVKHAVPDGDTWSISIVSTGYFYGPFDIQVDDQEVTHIAWHNHDTENEAYAVLVDGEWVVHDVDHPGHDGWDNTLAIDSTGRPHTASIDPSQFGSESGVEYATFDGQSWNVEEVGSGPVPYEFGTGIVLDAEDRPRVVWFDGSTKDLKYAIKEGNTWSITTIDSEGDVGRFPSLLLDGQGNPAVTYYEQITPSRGYIKFARWDGSRWNTQRIDTLESVFLGHFGARRNSALVLDKNDNPVVAYSDEQVVKLAWWDGSQWNVETVLTAGETPLGQQVSWVWMIQVCFI